MHKFERLCHKLKKQQFTLSFNEKVEIKGNNGLLNELTNSLK